MRTIYVRLLERKKTVFFKLYAIPYCNRQFRWIQSITGIQWLYALIELLVSLHIQAIYSGFLIAISLKNGTQKLIFSGYIKEDQILEKAGFIFIFPQLIKEVSLIQSCCPEYISIYQNRQTYFKSVGNLIVEGVLRIQKRPRLKLMLRSLSLTRCLFH